MSKRVVFLADSISTQKAGIHHYGRQLIDSIIAAYPQYEYFSISSSKIPNENLSQHIIPISNSIPFHLRWRQLLHIPKKARTLNPDIVIELAHFGPFNLPKNVKRITVIHDLSAVTHKEFHNTASHIVQRISLPAILRRTDSIICNSYYTKQDIMKVYGIDKSKIQVIYPAVNTPSILDSSDANFSFLSQSYFLCVGTIEPRKNYDTVIQAFDKVYQSHPDIHLVIVGMAGWKNESFDKVLSQSAAKSNIHITGFVTASQLDPIYMNAFAFISASHFEGFGIPILEAASRQLPLIVADNSSQKEIVGDRGILFSSTNIDQLKNAMETMLHSPKMRDELILKSKTVVSNIEQERKDQLKELKL